MSTFGKIKAFINRNMLLVVMVPGIGGIHYAWQQIQENDVFVAPHERREFPPITLLRHAKHWVGMGPLPEKHPPPSP